MPTALASLSLPALALVVFGFFAGLTVVSAALGFALERALPRRRVFDLPLFPGQLRYELLGNAVFVAVATAALTLTLHLGVVRLGAGGTLAGVLTFAALVPGFQVFYWLLHRAMHHRALVRIHRWHHRSQVTTPLSGQSMSVFEALGWMLGYVGLPCLLSQVAPLSFAGWAAYLAFNVFGNIVGHANVEPTAPAAATRGATWLANPFVFHALHHARWTGHYGFQGAMMDRLFGTEWDDWPALYAQIAAGRALTSLKTRGDQSPEGRAQRAVTVTRPGTDASHSSPHAPS